ncbi:hypothetical protein C8R46DRAFT_1140104 [Mycena filopes]|nr:hypothetical protein C8R46DRAFT_1140104 [Mycena filopes]
MWTTVTEPQRATMASDPVVSPWILTNAQITESAISLSLNVLVTLACYLLRRRKTPGGRVLMFAMVLGWGFSLGEMLHQVLFTAGLLRLLRSSGRAQDIDGTMQRLMQMKSVRDNVLALANNFAADSLFIYRCYVIWGESRHKIRVITGPILLLSFTTVFGIVNALLADPYSDSDSDSAAPNPSESFSVYSLGEQVTVGLGQVLTNLLLTALTAGRIWWTRRKLRVLGGETRLMQRCSTAVAMLPVFSSDTRDTGANNFCRLESSALYFVMVFTFFLMSMAGSASIPILWCATVQLMNILPALVIVRVSLARSVDSDHTAGNVKLRSTVH